MRMKRLTDRIALLFLLIDLGKEVCVRCIEALGVVLKALEARRGEEGPEIDRVFLLVL